MPTDACVHLITDHKPRCQGCGRVLGLFLTRPWAMRCKHCGEDNQSEPIPGLGEHRKRERRGKLDKSPQSE